MRCEEAAWHPGGLPGQALVLGVVTDSESGLCLRVWRLRFVQCPGGEEYAKGGGIHGALRVCSSSSLLTHVAGKSLLTAAWLRTSVQTMACLVTDTPSH